MTNSSPVTADIAHIEALLDDPMISLIMTIDRIDRDDARRLFCRVASRLKAGVAPSIRSDTDQASRIFFPKAEADKVMCATQQESRHSLNA